MTASGDRCTQAWGRRGLRRESLPLSVPRTRWLRRTGPIMNSLPSPSSSFFPATGTPSAAFSLRRGRKCSNGRLRRSWGLPPDTARGGEGRCISVSRRRDFSDPTRSSGEAFRLRPEPRMPRSSGRAATSLSASSGTGRQISARSMRPATSRDSGISRSSVSLKTTPTRSPLPSVRPVRSRISTCARRRTA